MHWQFTTSVLLYILSGAVTSVTAWMAWQQREQRGVVSLAYAMLATALWSFTGALEIAAVEPAAKLFFVVIEYAQAIFIVLLMLFFVFEYYRLDGWLTPNRRRLLWAPGGLMVGLAVTNEWHKLIWTGFVPGPPGSNLLIYLHGSGYYLAVGYDFLLVTIAIGALAWQAFRSAGRHRRRAAAMAVSLAMPLTANLVYVVFPMLTVTVDFLPIGFALAGFIISVIVFQDVKSQVVERTAALQATVQRLQHEITERQRTQDELHKVQDTLAQRVADQSRQLAALYEVVLVGGQAGTLGDILAQSLVRIVTALDAQAVCFHRFDADRDQLILAAQYGLAAPAEAQIAALPTAWLLDECVPCAVADLTTHTDVPDGIRLPGYNAYLGLAITRQGRSLGVLSAYWTTRERFSVEEIALFSAVAEQLGIIIENVRLRQSGEEAAVLRERQRLAREMHDSVTQSLHSMVLTADIAANRFKQGRFDKLEASLSQLRANAGQALKEMRLLLYELRPATLRDGGLAQALKLRVEAVERRTGIAADVVAEEIAGPWPLAWETDLYGIAMEALNNTLKHAQATAVTVYLRGGPDWVELAVRDNGQGFDPQQVSGSGMGLRSMAERAARLGGQLALESAPGQGTTVRVGVGG